MKRGLPVGGALALLAAACPAAGPAPVAPPAAVETPETLAFSVDEGAVHNLFYRRGGVAAHVLVTSGKAPRIVVAFPAGNSGAGLWFRDGDAAVGLDNEGDVEPVEQPDGMRGVKVRLRVRGGALELRQLILGSVRTLRDFGYTNRVDERVVQEVAPGPPFVARRASLDRKHHYLLTIEPGGDARQSGGGGEPLRVEPAAGGGAVFHVTLTALTDHEPLTPIPVGELLRGSLREGAAARDLQALAFLSYDEKLLAGSWRFLTYFGRDTLMTLRLLLPAASPRLIEAGLASVIDRLDDGGEVAHEEDIGDFAALRRLRQSPDDAEPGRPLYDYKMVDDDFMLAPLLAEYLLGTDVGAERATAFLARRTPAGLAYAEAVRRNLEFVLGAARLYAERPEPTHLVALKAGTPVGDWRDSGDGLGGGRYPFSVNAALVPAALEAATRLYASPLFGPDAKASARAAAMVGPWSEAREAFRMEIPVARADALVKRAATAEGLVLAPDDGADDPTVIYGVSLDAAGKPIPIMHSDDGFVMLFGRPPPAYLGGVAARILEPYPFGLRTAVGMVVANAAFVEDDVLRLKFGRNAYHGAVVWSWQQAMLLAGLERQLGRKDLDVTLRVSLGKARDALWAALAAAGPFRGSELWSWRVEDGVQRATPFGQGSADADESNAVQLWSTVYLAVRPPGGS